MRTKITAEKSKMQAKIEKYNGLSLVPLDVDSIMEGNFPWQMEVPSKDGMYSIQISVLQA